MTPTRISLFRLALVVAAAVVLGMAPDAHAQTYQYKTLIKGLTPSTPGAGEPEEPDSAWASAGVSATSLSFGATPVGTSVERSLTVFNNDDDGRPVRIDAISTDHPEFVASHDCPMAPAELAAGSSCTIAIDYLATQEAVLSQTLTVTTAANTRLVALSGRAGAGDLQVLHDMSGNYGDMEFEDEATRSITLANEGFLPVTIESANLVGSDVFSKHFDDCSGLELAPGGVMSCSVHVRVTAVPEGTHSASLQFIVDGQAVLTKALTVRGVVPFSVDTMTPAEVDSNESDHVIEITGNRFDGATFTVGGVPVEATISEDGKSAELVVPSIRFGYNPVVVSRAGESFSPTPAQLKGLVTLSIDSGSASGGDEMVISGNGFDANTRVNIAGTDATITAWSATSLTVITPPGPAGQTGVVRIQRMPGTFLSGRDLELTSAFTYEDEETAEGEVQTIKMEFAWSSAQSTLAYSPSNSTVLWRTNTGAIRIQPISLTYEQSYYTAPTVTGTHTGLRSDDGLAVSPWAPVGYIFYHSGAISWFNVDGTTPVLKSSNEIKKTYYPIIPNSSDLLNQGFLSQDGGTIVLFLNRSTNPNGNSLMSIPVDATGTPMFDEATVAGNPSVPNGYGMHPRSVTAGPNGSVWMLYTASGKAPLLRWYADTSMSNPTDYVLPLTGDGAYPITAPSAEATRGFSVDHSGMVYIAMQHAIYRFNPATQTGGIFVGNPTQGGLVDGVGADARLNNIVSMTYSNGKLLTIDAHGTYQHLREIVR